MGDGSCSRCWRSGCWGREHALLRRTPPEASRREDVARQDLTLALPRAPWHAVAWASSQVKTFKHSESEAMTLDIRGSLKNTRISTSMYVVLEELISNSIDAFLIRRHSDPGVEDLKIWIGIVLSSSGVIPGQLDLKVSCKDNGCGLADEQLSAFLTKDTSYKDDLHISGIGKCKGAGRIQYFHHFERIEINSHYPTAQGCLKRVLKGLLGEND
jgi:hypothetical protein